MLLLNIFLALFFITVGFVISYFYFNKKEKESEEKLRKSYNDYVDSIKRNYESLLKDQEVEFQRTIQLLKEKYEKPETPYTYINN